MAKLVEMDERVGIFTQMEEDVGPVILINKFSVDPKEFDQFLKGYAADSEKFKQQPGLISIAIDDGLSFRPGSLSRNKPGMLVAVFSQSLASSRNRVNL
jgi:hypothetical protein